MLNKKVLASSFLGNTLEFYDFTLYGVFAVTLGAQFFPSSNPLNSLLASWGTFAAGFIMRPFGASLFGFIGDKLGRKKALGLSIIFMGLPTLLIGLLPTYQSIGIAAPFLLILCRLLQGLCTGGEYNGSAIFALEHHFVKKGLISGIITSSCVMGALSATGVGFLVTHYGNPEWSWRIPFILGAFISFLGFFIRKAMSESPEFLESHQNKKTYFSHLRETILYNPQAVLMTFLLGSLNGVLSYSLFGFLNMYFHKYLQVNTEVALVINLFGLFAFMAFCPFAGYILDKMGKQRFLRFSLLLAIILPLGVYQLFTFKTIFILISAQILYGVLVGLIAGPQHAIAQSLFPTSYRYTGVALSFSAGMGIIGGTTPLIATYLIEKVGSLHMPALWVSGIASLTLLNYLVFSKRRAPSFELKQKLTGA